MIPRLEIYLPVLIFDQNLQSYYTPFVLTTSIRRIFERRGGARKSENNEDQKKKKTSPLKISPFSCPKLAEDQKKHF